MTCTCMCHVPHAHAMWSHSRVGRALLSPRTPRADTGPWGGTRRTRPAERRNTRPRRDTHAKSRQNNDQQSASCLERLAQTHNLFLVLSDVLRQEALHFGELLLRRHRPSLELRALAL